MKEAGHYAHALTRLLVLMLCLSTSGCYYLQAAAGQWQVIKKREPIETVIEDTSTPTQLVERLMLVQEARTFSVDELALPDNKSYRSYADIERDYVVWNVFAAPEFSLEPRRWCFPIAGCVSYRGFFPGRRLTMNRNDSQKKGSTWLSAEYRHTRRLATSMTRC